MKPTNSNKNSRQQQKSDPADGMRLNKYLAHAGVCSRRKADELIKQGKVSVNGSVVDEPGYKVKQGDEVVYEGKVLKGERKVYILFNKTKDLITTTSDERGRRTVMDIILPKLNRIKKYEYVRIFPVGRLDRNTTGLLLLTNDGDLAQKLTHPSSNIKKVYRAELNKGLKDEDLELIRKGLTLEDGYAPVDEVAFPDPSNKKIVGIELHLGRNRIVRRIFEHLGYDVKKLDRVVFASLTKLDLPRGKWRFLKDKEIITLKHFTR